MKRYIATISAVLLGSTAAIAAPTVADIDINDDDFVSFEEMTAAYTDLTAEQFQQIDANNDNRVSSNELLKSEAQEIVSLYEGVQLPLQLIDMNDDGFSEYEEFSAVFTDLDRNEFHQMDSNGDNRLSQIEIDDMDAQIILNRYRSMEDVATVGKADVDGDNFLTSTELMSAYPGLTENEFDKIDTNDDNRVDFTELYESDAQTIVSKYAS